MNKDSRDKLRGYGQQENSYVLANIFGPNASLYNDIEKVGEIAMRACSQAESAFGAEDPIYIEALLNLSLFHWHRSKNIAEALPVLEKARSLLSVAPGKNNELLAELLAIKVLVSLEKDHTGEELFVIDDLAGFAESPFGLSAGLPAPQNVVEIYRNMVIVSMDSSHPVRSYLVAEIGKPLADQLAYAGFKEAAAEVVAIMMPLLDQVWGADSEKVAYIKAESDWREKAGSEDLEFYQFLLQCRIFIQVLVPYNIVLQEVPVYLSEAHALFNKGLDNNKKIANPGETSLVSTMTEAVNLFTETIIELNKQDDISPPVGASELMRLYSNAFLGCLYLTFPGEKNRQYVEDAILFLEEALDVFYHGDFVRSDDIRMVADRIRVLLAYAYYLRTQGDPEENVDQILVHTDSIELEKNDDPYLWALNKWMRAMGYYLRKQTKVFTGAKTDGFSSMLDFSAALGFLDEALDVFKEDDFPFEWATNLLTWVLIFGEILSAETSQDARRVLAQNIRVAEFYFTPENDPYNWMKLQLVKAKLATFCRDDNDRSLPAKPMEILRRTQSFLSKQEFPAEWARVEWEKALVLSGEHPVEAIEHYKNCLAIFDSSYERERFLVLRESGSLLFSHKHFEKAIVYLKECFDLGQEHLAQGGSMQARRLGISNMEGISRKLAYSLFAAGRFDEAVIAFEKGKSLLLYDILSLRSAQLTSLGQDDRLQYDKLLEEIKTLESDGYGGMGYIEDMEKLVNARREARDILKNHGIARNDDTIGSLTAIPENSALLMPLITEHGGAIFILTAGLVTIGEEHIIHLPDLTSQIVEQWLSKKEEGWFDVYSKRNEQISDGPQFEDAIVRMSEIVGDSLLRQAVERLETFKISEIIFVPTVGLQFLPISCAVIGDSMIVDRFRFRVVPSARILSVISAKGPAPENTKAVVAAVGEYEDWAPLPNATREGAAIAKILSVEPLLDGEVTMEKLNSRLKNASYIHLACHGDQWAEDPNFGRSFTPPAVLHLSKEGISFKDILVNWDLHSSKVITTSACDTALVEFDRPWDEFEGLSNIFMQAGAKTIIGSLWSVDDESTALIMIRFYETVINGGENCTEALRKTQVWLRDSTHALLTAEYPDIYTSYASDKSLEDDFRPFEHPYFWAPFFITGI